MKTSVLLLGIVIGSATDAQGTVTFSCRKVPRKNWLRKTTRPVNWLSDLSWPCPCGRSRAGGSSIARAGPCRWNVSP